MNVAWVCDKEPQRAFMEKSDCRVRRAYGLKGASATGRVRAVWISRGRVGMACS